MSRPKITEDFLVEEFCRQGKKQKDIASETGYSISYISKQIKKYKLKPPTETKYIGEKFGNLLVLKKVGFDQNSHMIFECLCICGKKLVVKGYSLLSANTTSCGCTARKMGMNHANYRGYQEIRNVMWQSLIRGAKERKMEFNLTIEYAWNLYIKQNRKCALTGLPITFAAKTKTTKFSTASLDRIDSSKGYTEGNVQWVHKKINFMKQGMKEDDFIYFCILIANKFQGKTYD